MVVTAEFGEALQRARCWARLAGDDSLCFFPQIQSSADVERIARRIAQAIAEPLELCGHSVDIRRIVECRSARTAPVSNR